MSKELEKYEVTFSRHLYINLTISATSQEDAQRLAEEYVLKDKYLTLTLAGRNVVASQDSNTDVRFLLLDEELKLEDVSKI